MYEDFDLGPTKFNVGDKVRRINLRSPYSPVFGQVIERRGGLGDQGSQLYTVMLREEPLWTMTLGDDDMELVEAAPPQPPRWGIAPSDSASSPSA